MNYTRCRLRKEHLGILQPFERQLLKIAPGHFGLFYARLFRFSAKLNFSYQVDPAPPP